MSLWQRLFAPQHPTPRADPEAEAKALKEYDMQMSEQRGEARSERDRTARIAAYVRCMEAGGTDCRVQISWEELAEQGRHHG
jgi:hypothetical protein